MRSEGGRRRIARGAAVSIFAVLLGACGGRSDIGSWEDSGAGTSGVSGAGGRGGSSDGGQGSGGPSGGGTSGGGGFPGGPGGVAMVGAGGLPIPGTGGLATAGAPGEAPLGTGGTAGGGGSAGGLCPNGTFRTGTGECLAWSSCLPGSYVAQPGTAFDDQVCSPCQAGTFSDTSNLTACRSWTVCSIAEEQASPGSSDGDVACEPVSPFGFVGSGIHSAVRALVATDTSLFAAGVDVTDHAVQQAALHEISFEGIELSQRFFTASNRTEATGITAVGNRLVLSGSTRGAFPGPAVGEDDAFLRLIETDGSLVWGEQFGTDRYEIGVLVTTGASGSVYVTGSTEGSLDAPVSGETDMFLRKYDASGNLAWAQQLSRGEADLPQGLAADAGGNVYLVGTADESVGFLLAFAEDGTLLWALDSSDLGCASCSAVALAEDGDLYVAGTVASTGPSGGVSLARVTPSGIVTWSTPVGGQSGVEYVVRALAVAGPSVHVFGSAITYEAGLPRADALAMSFETGGTSIGVEIWGGTAYEAIDAVVVTPGGEILIAGTISWWETNAFRGYVLPWAPDSP